MVGVEPGRLAEAARRAVVARPVASARHGVAAAARVVGALAALRIDVVDLVALVGLEQLQDRPIPLALQQPQSLLKKSKMMTPFL